ncbi:MAG: GTP-binding protein [Thermoplasmata archaeon]|nr:GTP-binding protein [Thermoplasmata archaeon]
MNEAEFRKIKICLVGDLGVGKTSLIRRYVLDQFDDKYIATIGTKVTKKNLSIINPKTGREEFFSLLIWDIMGQPSFREILRESYFFGAQGSLCICDVTDKDTFHELRYWIKAMTATAGPVPMVIIGNKIDLKENVQISLGELKSFAEGLNSQALLTSAKTGENVEKAFLMLVDTLIPMVTNEDATYKIT